MDQILPLEQTDPVLAEHLRKIANREHPKVRGVSASWQRREYVLWDDDTLVTETKPPGRNENCPCGSGRKYKKCHGKP